MMTFGRTRLRSAIAIDTSSIRLSALWSWLKMRAAATTGLIAEVQKRTRIHHVYYLLAAFDVAAVIGGLVLTHQSVGTLSSTVRSNLQWSELHSQMAALRGVAGRANAPGNDVFESKDAAAELRRLNEAADDFGPALAIVKSGIYKKVPNASLRAVQSNIETIEASLDEMLRVTRSLLIKYANGDVEAASSEMAVMDRRYSDALGGIETTAQQLRSIENVIAQEMLNETTAYRRLEIGFVVIIVLMVTFVTMYGNRVSQLVERQNAQLTAFNIELEARVSQRTAELAASKAEIERHREELRLRNHHFEVAVNNMNRGLCLFNDQQRIVVANKRYLDMYDLDPAQHQPGTALSTILANRVKKGHFPGHSAEDYCAERLAAVASRQVSVSVHSLRDGRVIEVGHYPTDDGGWVTTHDDITDRRRMEQQIIHLAHHDALTGLPNRRKLREEIEAALKRSERGDEFAVLCLDLDHFKQVNDTLGHPIGDRLLQAVAGRLRNTVRKSDIVSRLGGDEFAIVQLMVEQPTGSTSLADRVIAAVSEPYEIDGHQLVIGTSIGIAFAPSDGDSADALLKNADLALYRAKVDGKGVYRLFEAEMDERAKARRKLELDLRKAVALEEFQLFYQPLIVANTGEVSGFEALIRWQHKERGLVPPNEFLPLAEDIGLMGDIGAWVLKKACTEAMQWPSHCRVAVNISPSQLRTRQLDLDVMAAIAASGIDPKRLELEITETVLLERTEDVLVVLHRLRDFGVRISMDDFGTGYSSLSYLQSFPFDKIKIDQSFTQSTGKSSHSLAIVQAVLGLGKNLGMSTTAEGVETVEQLSKLREEGCVELQGYLFSKPVPASEVQGLLDRLKSNACHAA